MFVSASTTPAAVYAGIKRELTVTPTTFGQSQFPRHIKLYRECPGGIEVPTAYAVSKLGFAMRNPSFSTARPLPKETVFCGELKDSMQQVEAAEAVMRDLAESPHSCMLSLPTGFGKTVVALHVAKTLGLQTLVIVHRNLLVDQWTERVKQYLPTLSTSLVRGKSSDCTGDVTIAMLQTCLARPGMDYSSFGTVILDEAHHVCAKHFSNIMFAVRSVPYKVCLSATPFRKDGLSCVLTHWIGKTSYIAHRRQQTHVEVRAYNYTCDAYRELPPMNRHMGTVNHPAVISALCDVGDRTALIARIVEALVREERRKVLVLSHRRQHCEDLVSILIDAGIAARAFLGGAKKKSRKNKENIQFSSPQLAMEDAAVVCSTFANVSEGFDDSSFTALVLSTPSSDVQQSVGRLLRGDCTAPVVVVDVHDKWLPCYASAKKRAVFYRQSGFVVKNQNVDVPVLQTFAFTD